MIRILVISLLAVVLIYSLHYTYSSVASKNVGPYGINIIGGSRGHDGVSKETFLNPADIDYKMGEYSGVKLDNDDKIKYDKLYGLNVGNQDLHIDPEPCDSFECLNGIVPSIDGTPEAPKSAAIFKYNRSLPECCPGPYSTSTGCVCPTTQQKKYIDSRGNNK